MCLKLGRKGKALTQGIGPRPSDALPKEWPFMVYEHYDFARNPIVEDHEFSLDLNVFVAVFQLWRVRSRNFWKRKSAIVRSAR